MHLKNHKGQVFEIDEKEIDNSLFENGGVKYLSFQAMDIQMQKKIYEYCIKNIGYCEEDAFDFFFLLYFITNNQKEYLYVSESGLTEQGLIDIQNDFQNYTSSPCCLSLTD